MTLFKVIPLMFLLALREIDITSATNMKSKEDIGHPCLIPLEVAKASLACPLLVGIHRGSLFYYSVQRIVNYMHHTAIMATKTPNCQHWIKVS